MNNKYRDRVVRRAIQDIVPTRADRRQMRKWAGKQRDIEWRRFGHQSKGVPGDSLNLWINAGLKSGKMAPRPAAPAREEDLVDAIRRASEEFDRKKCPTSGRLIYGEDGEIHEID